MNIGFEYHGPVTCFECNLHFSKTRRYDRIRLTDVLLDSSVLSLERNDTVSVTS